MQHSTTAPRAPRPGPAALDPTTIGIAEWIGSLLQIDQARPRRCARMQPPSAADKYLDIPKAARFGRGDLISHARAHVTWSCSLDHNGYSRAGVIEIDEGGRAALLATLDAAAGAGRVAFAFEQHSAQHTGGHVWIVYTHPAPIAAITAEMHQIRSAAGLPSTTEIWPQNQGIRAPFGYHRHNQTRGALLLQSGEIIALDTELAAGFAAVRELPTNSAPAPAPTVERVQSEPKASPKRLLNLTTAQPRQRTSAGRASLDEVKARFAAEHTLSALIESYGARATKDGYTCPFCEHTHQTTLYISKQGRLFSYSPNCKLYTTKGWDAFGLYVFLEHNNDVIAAARALNPIEPRPKRQQAPLAEPEPRRTQTPAQAADAARKRQQRSDEAAQIRADVERRASQDARLSDTGQLVLLGLLDVAGDRAWCRPSVARLAAMISMKRRSVFYGLAELERRGYIRSSVAPGRTTVRTFLRVQAQSAENGAMHPDLNTSTDLTLTMGASERAPEPPALGDADSLDTWQAAGDDHSPDELAFLDAPAADLEIAPPPAEPPTLPPGAQLVRSSAWPFCWATIGGLTGPSRPRSTPDAVLIADALVLAAQLVPVEPEAPAGPQASYSPPAVEPSGSYTGRAKHLVDFSTRWAWANEGIKIRAVEPGSEPEAEQATLDSAPPPPRKPSRRRSEISALDRYRVDVTMMQPAQLAGEVKKHLATLKKHAGAIWLDQVREKLAIVQAEIDERDAPAAVEHASAEPARASQARGPQARPAAAAAQQAGLWGAA